MFGNDFQDSLLHQLHQLPRDQGKTDRPIVPQILLLNLHEERKESLSFSPQESLPIALTFWRLINNSLALTSVSSSMTGVRTVSKNCFFLYSDIQIQLYTFKYYIPMPTKLFLFNRNRRPGVRAPVTVIKGFYRHYRVLSKMTTSCSFKTSYWNNFTGHYDHKS